MEDAGHAGVLQRWEWGAFREAEGLHVSRYVVRTEDGYYVVQAWRKGRSAVSWAPEGPVRVREAQAEPLRGAPTPGPPVLLIAPMLEANGSGPGEMVFVSRRWFATGNTIVDLGLDQDEILRRQDQKWRNQLRKAQKLGVRARRINPGDAAAIYQEEAQDLENRKHFRSPWTGTRLKTLASCLPDSFGILAEDAGGRRLSISFIARAGPVAMLVAAATNEVGRDVAAGYGAHWSGVAELKKSSAQWYNLGGYKIDSDPGVARFKRGCGGSNRDLPGVFALIRWKCARVVLEAGVELMGALAAGKQPEE